jgi:putative membrane protein
MSTPTLFASDTAQVLLAHNGDGPGGWWPIFPILLLLVIGTIITTIVLSRRRHHAWAGPRAGEAKLAERFAAGEITEQEYRERRAVLREQTR